ncbi:unnamed protein product [Paramecium sonneborni]|uniref:Uncharacterized protein n=1 Tax=Paramecium sonneborni TaxID=65129 RepID=A0A8S1KFX4_9CILI|nr:unnamed protein product [Paramecium sonneborni]
MILIILKLKYLVLGLIKIYSGFIKGQEQLFLAFLKQVKLLQYKRKYLEVNQQHQYRKQFHAKHKHQYEQQMQLSLLIQQTTKTFKQMYVLPTLKYHLNKVVQPIAHKLQSAYAHSSSIISTCLIPIQPSQNYTIIMATMGRIMYFGYPNPLICFLSKKFLIKNIILSYRKIKKQSQITTGLQYEQKLGYRQRFNHILYLTEK